MTHRAKLICLLAGILPCTGTGCIVIGVGGWSFGGTRIWTEPVSGQLAVQSEDLNALKVRTHNGSIAFDGQSSQATDVHVVYSKKAGAPTLAGAEAALEMLDVFVEPAGPGTQRIGWRWNGLKKPGWSACVNFEISAPGNVDLDAVTHNGSVRIDGVRGDTHVSTHNGGVSVEASGGILHAKTHNGRIQATYSGEAVTLATHNGQVEADLRDCASVDGGITTHNGSVEVTIGESTSADLKCRTHNGSVRCDAPLSNVESSRRRLTGRLGGGDGYLRVTTHNGSVRIKTAAG